MLLAHIFEIIIQYIIIRFPPAYIITFTRLHALPQLQSTCIEYTHYSKDYLLRCRASPLAYNFTLEDKYTLDVLYQFIIDR